MSWPWFFRTKSKGEKQKNKKKNPQKKKKKKNHPKNKVRLLLTKKLLHNKGNQQQDENATYQMGENICKLYIW